MRRAVARVAVVIGVLLLVGAGLWKPVVQPALLRFPSDLDQTLHYQGTFAVFADPATGASLPAPLELPLRVDRRVRVVDSSFSTVVVRERIVQHLGTQRPVVEEHQYVMDRRTMELKGGPQSWSYRPTNQVDRSGTYRVNFPMGASADGAYPIWGNETSSSAAVQRATVGHDDGLRVLRYAVAGDDVVIPAYREHLLSQGLPDTLGLDALRPRLAAVGIDVEAASATLLPVLSPEDAATVARVLATPVPVVYRYAPKSTVSVEPTTGAMTNLAAVDEVAASADPAALQPLLDVLSKYEANPDVARLVAGLERLAAAPPQTVFQARYTQTPASVADVVGMVREQRSQVRLVQGVLPVGLAALGALLVGLGLFGLRHRHDLVPVALSEPLPEPVGALAPGGGSPAEEP